MYRITHLFIRAFEKALHILHKWDERFGGRTFRAERHRKLVIRSAECHSMTGDADEAYYRDQYWFWMEKYFRENHVSPVGSFLDLGCGQGRFSSLIAEHYVRSGGKVVGVDISPEAIRVAEAYKEEKNLSSTEYRVDDLVPFLKQSKDNSFDAVLFIEVAFFLPGWESVTKEILRVLKPGGLLCASFRSRYFSLLYSIACGKWSDVPVILEKKEGVLWNTDIHFVWGSNDETKQFLEETGFDVLGVMGIGNCSGIEGDPLAPVARPSGLDEEETKLLMKSELAVAESVPDAGRYMFYVAKKK